MDQQKSIPQLTRNILAQPDSLSGVLRRQRGEGRPALLEAAKLLRPAKRVLITGIGASMFASIPFEYFLCSQGIDAVVIEAAELLHYRKHAFQDAIAVVVSRSGESVEIARLLATLKGRQPVIGVTNEPDSTLAQAADVSLCLGSLPDEMVAIQTYTGTLLTLHLLAEIISHGPNAAGDPFEALQAALAERIAAGFERLEEWDSLLDTASPLYLLARGPSYASALEGALLFNEIAKAPAVGLPAASFRHGPVEVVDSAFRAIIFAPEGCTRELNLALSRDLSRFGGRIRLIGPSENENGGCGLPCSVPPMPETLVPLFEIVPVQWAALRMAQLRGIAAGSFRYAPQVATDEASFASRPSP